MTFDESEYRYLYRRVERRCQRRTVKGWLRWPFRQLRWPGGEMLP